MFWQIDLSILLRKFKKSHQHDVVYYAACLEPGCVEDDTGETSSRLNDRVIDQNGTGKKSYLYKHSQESKYPCVALTLRSLVAIFKIQSLKEKLLSHCWLERSDHHWTRKRYQSH